MNKLNTQLLLFFVFGASIVYGQKSIHTSGDDVSGSGGSVSFSVGQTVNSFNTTSSGSVSQGVQQTYKVSDLGIKQTELNIALSVYPNPVTNNLVLEIDELPKNSISYQLLDINGKELIRSTVENKTSLIDMTNFSPATYLINVIKDNTIIQSFKIIKN